MGRNKDLQYYKKQVQKINPKLYVKNCINTVTCPIDHMMRSNVFVSKQPVASKIKSTAYGGNEGVNTKFFNAYNTEKDVVHLSQAINNIVEWVSDLKMLSSTFNNYLWQRLIDENEELPEINDVFFTNLLNAVSGKKTDYGKYFDEFASIFEIENYLPWLSNTSQVICDLKNEMTVVTTPKAQYYSQLPE